MACAQCVVPCAFSVPHWCRFVNFIIRYRDTLLFHLCSNSSNVSCDTYRCGRHGCWHDSAVRGRCIKYHMRDARASHDWSAMILMKGVLGSCCCMIRISGSSVNHRVLLLVARESGSCCRCRNGSFHRRQMVSKRLRRDRRPFLPSCSCIQQPPCVRVPSAKMRLRQTKTFLRFGLRPKSASEACRYR